MGKLNGMSHIHFHVLIFIDCYSSGSQFAQIYMCPSKIQRKTLKLKYVSKVFIFPYAQLKSIVKSGQALTNLFPMSHFSYACKMRCPLNLVLESWEYLWFYLTFWIAILDCGLKLHKLSIHTLVMLQK